MLRTFTIVTDDKTGEIHWIGNIPLPEVLQLVQHSIIQTAVQEALKVKKEDKSTPAQSSPIN